MIRWQEFIDALGKTESSIEFLSLKKSIGETPVISDTPIEYNDPNRTKFYEFFNKGILLNFKDNTLEQVHLYLANEEDYQAYRENLFSGINTQWNEIKIIELLGIPSASGGGKQDMLIGYINRWIAYYQEDTYSLRFEFAQDGFLCAVTLTILPV